MSVHPADAVPTKFSKIDTSMGAVCSRAIGKFPGTICIGFLLLFFGLSIPYKDAPAKMSGSSNNDWTVVMPPTDVNDMWNDAKRRTSMADPERKVNARSNMASAGITYLYKWDTSIEDGSKKDIFTSESLQEMCELERYFVDDDEYATTFCQLTYKNNSDIDDGCAAQRLSAPRLFYAATFYNHTIDCPLPDNYRTLMVTKSCMDHLSITATQATSFGAVPEADIIAIATAVGKQAAGAPLSNTETAALASTNGVLLTSNSNTGLNFFSCASANGDGPWTDYSGVSVKTTVLNQKNPQYHAEECMKIIKKVRETIEDLLPVPIIATNPSDQQKYYVTSMPGSPTTQFNFTSFHRSNDMNDGAYQLMTDEACPLLPKWHVEAVKEWLYTTVQLKNIQLGAANMTGEQLLGFFMDKDTLDRKFTSRSRSMIYMGSPLSDYKDSADRGKEQKDLYDAYMMKGEPKLFKQFNMIDTAKLSH